MSDFYTTRTANLRATRGDFSKIDAKQIILNGKNILDYISDSEFNSYDTRDPQLKNDEKDIWNTEISLSKEGHIEVKPLEHTVAALVTNPSFLDAVISAAKVIDNEVLGHFNMSSEAHLVYWQTDGLTDGSELLSGILTLSTFNSNLSSLTNGYSMFRNCRLLTTFNSDLSSLTNGEMMFDNTKLTTFDSDLSSLTNGRYMFYGCTNLTTFNSDLSSLTNGYSMFFNTKLDAPSIANIVHTLPTHETNGEITIGVGCDNTEADKLLFAQECDCETWQELLDDFSAKNWTVTFQCNGRPTTTYNMRRGETLPIYTKLEEVTDENHYQYTSADGSKFYNINYFHSTNGSTEGYDVFSSLEEAISTYNVTPKN